MAEKTMITPKQEAFVQALLRGETQRKAYRAAYPASKTFLDKTVDEKASRLFADNKVRARFDELRGRLVKEAEDETIITAKEVLKRWRDIAYADPNELIHYRRVCCRHCFGIGHEYQWIDEAEYQRAVEGAKKNTPEGETPKVPSFAGGYGFDNTIRPHPKCPKCKGEGYGQVHVSDTRDLSPNGQALYAGVKQTNTGLEIVMKSQEKALESIAKHLGMFTDKVEITGSVTLEQALREMEEK